MASELQLIEAAKAGSADAFADLVRSYRERLLRFLLTRCSSLADAEDVLQDTLISAYRYIHSYDPRWRFSTWLYRIAIRNAVDGDAVPVPHFGCVLAMADWEALRDRLMARGDITWIIEPRVRFAGKPGEQATMFVLDPSGNALEFKAFADMSQLFAT